MTALRLTPLVLLLAAACVEVSDRKDSTAARAKIDTTSGALAVTPTAVDTTPASVTPLHPPLIGPDSLTRVHGVPTGAVAQVLRADTTATLRVVDSTPASVPSTDDLAILRREMIVPVSGFTGAMLYDSYDELRGGTRKHEALDILAARGTPVISAANGRILKLFESKAGGHMIYAADSTERFILMYAHLDGYQPGLVEGQRITQGQPIGTVGTTGNAAANVPHLHFAIARSPDVRIWWKGSPVNPYPLLAH